MRSISKSGGKLTKILVIDSNYTDLFCGLPITQHPVEVINMIEVDRSTKQWGCKVTFTKRLPPVRWSWPSYLDLAATIDRGLAPDLKEINCYFGPNVTLMPSVRFVLSKAVHRTLYIGSEWAERWLNYDAWNEADIPFHHYLTAAYSTGDRWSLSR